MPTTSCGSTPCHKVSQPRSVRIGGVPPPIRAVATVSACGRKPGSRRGFQCSASGEEARLIDGPARHGLPGGRSEEHTSELQSLMRISYAVFCLTKKHDIHHTGAIHISTTINNRHADTLITTRIRAAALTLSPINPTNHH